MINERTLQRITQATQLTPHDLVLEIGAGPGNLTRWLAQTGCHLVAVENDPRLVKICQEELEAFPNCHIVEADILTIRLEKLAQQVPASNRPWVIVGNLPYSITSPILEWVIRQRRLIDRCVFTVQQEVARRLTASPGCKAYGSLTVFVQYAASVRPLFSISRGQFYPQPEVDSTCLELVIRSQPPVHVNDEDRFFALIQSLFAYRRKILLNALQQATHLSRQQAMEGLIRAGLDPHTRIETCSLERLAALAETILWNPGRVLL